MRRILACTCLCLAPAILAAQHVHDPSMHAQAPQRAVVLPTQPGQDAYAAIAEIVRILDADSATDWSKVNLEALRAHLVDMTRVTLHAQSRTSNVPNGLQMDVTGDPETAAAIRRMLGEHVMMLDAMDDYAASATEIPGGMRLTVRAKRGDDRTTAKIRGLGFIGLLTVGAHHAEHHLALARGEAMHH